ncbi:sensor domain-containing diguanylate cyclase [Parahaliea mediterranea]|uniref:diguanylate cyclase n=1 Tax=Parahaliea mediterranea TaxID=651086 RepID=A0A939DCC3_9GAMM|nr:diguanylate cyclase [Parahaliea mediterranea]MBN7795546.1 diguanylate cyclase [Parahaliea mediterranea]
MHPNFPGSGSRGASLAARPCCLLLIVALLAAWPGLSTARDSATPSPPAVVTVQQVLDGLTLRDGWKFRAGDERLWADPAFDDSGWQQVRLPHRWYPGPDAGPEAGFGWYRLRISLALADGAQREQLGHLGLQLGTVLSAYELYAGGERVGGVGVLPPAAKPAIDYGRQRILDIPVSAISADGELVLALRVWGGSETLTTRWGAGPYRGDVRLGRFENLLIARVIAEMPGLLIGFIYLVFGAYHLYLYSRNRHLEGFLWFGLTALAIGIYSLVLNGWRYYLGWEFLTFKKIEFGVVYVVPALALQTVWSLLDAPVGRCLRLYQFTFVAMALVCVLIPGLDIHVLTLGPWQVWTLPALGLTSWLIVRKARDGHDEARTIFIGGTIFIVACLHDILSDQFRLGATRMIPWGFLAFLLSMAVSLGNRFTAMINRLEEEVTERTAELSEANRQLSEAARIDPLTGLYNRRGFTEAGEAEIQRVFRSGRSFCVVLADIDHFKSINDRHGHACGDHVLARVAAKLRDSVRDVDRVARWGGEEFILLLPETDGDGAAVLAEKLRVLVEENMFQCEGGRLQVTMTFGVSAFRKGESLDSCIDRADRALYQGKDEGRNRVMVGSYRGLTLIT